MYVFMREMIFVIIVLMYVCMYVCIYRFSRLGAVVRGSRLVERLEHYGPRPAPLDPVLLALRRCARPIIRARFRITIKLGRAQTLSI